TRRDSNCGGRLLDRHASKEATLDNPTLAGTDPFEPIQDFVDCYQAIRVLVAHMQGAVGSAPQVAQRHRAKTAAPLFCLPVASVVAHDMSNGGRGKRKKMRARLEVNLALFHELQVRFVDECGGVEHPARIPASPLPVSEQTQLNVNERIQFVER